MGAPEQNLATPAEVWQAIEGLTPAQLLRLEKFARWRVRGLGRKSLGRDYRDLLQEGLTSTLAGTRRWNKHAVDLVGHLLGTMRSISSHWDEQCDDAEPYLESEVITNTAEGEEINPLRQTASNAPSQDRVAMAKEELAKIEKVFEEDPIAILVIHGLREGMKGPEIQQILEISRNKYDAAVKRIRRNLRSAGG